MKKKVILSSFIAVVFSLALIGSGENNNQSNDNVSDSLIYDYDDANDVDTLDYSEPVRNEIPGWLVGTWIRTIREGRNVGQLILRIHEDGSGVFETIDRGSDGLLYKKLDSFHFESAEIHDEELWLCKVGQKLKDTPIMKVRYERVYGYDGSEFEKMEYEQVDSLEVDSF